MTPQNTANLPSPFCGTVADQLFLQNTAINNFILINFFKVRFKNDDVYFLECLDFNAKSF